MRPNFESSNEKNDRKTEKINFIKHHKYGILN